MNVGLFIRQARKKAKLTQVELAMKLGVGQTQIANIEKGRCTPSFAVAIKLVDLFGAEVFLGKPRRKGG